MLRETEQFEEKDIVKCLGNVIDFYKEQVAGPKINEQSTK